MKPSLLLQLLSLVALAGCVTVPATPPASGPGRPDPRLEGKWKLVSFVCEKGEQDAVVRTNERRIAQGLEEQVLTIHGDTVLLRTVSRENLRKTDSCTIEGKQVWNIQDGTYQVASYEIVKKSSVGNGKCPPGPDEGLTGLVRPYELEGDRLKLVISRTRKQDHAKISGARFLCHGGDWVRIYQKAR